MKHTPDTSQTIEEVDNVITLCVKSIEPVETMVICVTI